MSDEKKAGDGIHENHWCAYQNCPKWGGFGYSKSNAEKPIWHCWEHYPYKEPLR